MPTSFVWKRVKWGVFLLGGVGALSLAYKAGVSAAPLPGPRLSAVDASPTDPAHANAGKTALRDLDSARLARLEETVKRLSERAQRAQDKSAGAAAPSAAEDNQRPNLSPEEELALGAVQRATTVEVARHRIEDETRDMNWAPQFEAAILRGGQEAFPKLNFTNVKCKTTLCELKVTAATRAELDKFILDFPPAFPLADQAHYEPLDLGDGVFGVELHVVRRGSGEEFEQEVAANAKQTFDRMTL
jgi:hypothetical protein